MLRRRARAASTQSDRESTPDERLLDGTFESSDADTLQSAARTALMAARCAYRGGSSELEGDVDDLFLVVFPDELIGARHVSIPFVKFFLNKNIYIPVVIFLFFFSKKKLSFYCFFFQEKKTF